MPSDYDKAQLGKDYQRQAKQAYENGEFEQAYHLYDEAETLYRKAQDEGESWVITRLFFMQSSVLRCLEAILDDRPILFGVYHSKVEIFLEEWTEEKINIHLVPKQRHNAIAFRAWRESYLKGLHEFSLASRALDQGDVPSARKTLKEFIARMEASKDEEAEMLCALARSKIEMLPVLAERRKHEQQRNISVIASGYLRAARVSYLPKNAQPRQRQLFAAYRAWFSSDALKWRAFSMLREKSLLIPSLAKAQRYFTRAVKYAQRAAQLGDFPSHHAVYLTYWRDNACTCSHI